MLLMLIIDPKIKKIDHSLKNVTSLIDHFYHQRKNIKLYVAQQDEYNQALYDKYCCYFCIFLVFIFFHSSPTSSCFYFSLILDSFPRPFYVLSLFYPFPKSFISLFFILYTFFLCLKIWKFDKLTNLHFSKEVALNKKNIKSDKDKTFSSFLLPVFQIRSAKRTSTQSLQHVSLQNLFMILLHWSKLRPRSSQKRKTLTTPRNSFLSSLRHFKKNCSQTTYKKPGWLLKRRFVEMN